jgi:hypothetical protein
MRRYHLGVRLLAWAAGWLADLFKPFAVLSMHLRSRRPSSLDLVDPD